MRRMDLSGYYRRSLDVVKAVKPTVYFSYRRPGSFGRGAVDAPAGGHLVRKGPILPAPHSRQHLSLAFGARPFHHHPTARMHRHLLPLGAFHDGAGCRLDGIAEFLNVISFG